MSTVPPDSFANRRAVALFSDQDCGISSRLVLVAPRYNFGVGLPLRANSSSSALASARMIFPPPLEGCGAPAISSAMWMCISAGDPTHERSPPATNSSCGATNSTAAPSSKIHSPPSGAPGLVAFFLVRCCITTGWEISFTPSHEVPSITRLPSQ